MSCVAIESVERPCAERKTPTVRKRKGCEDAGRGLNQRGRRGGLWYRLGFCGVVLVKKRQGL